MNEGSIMVKEPKVTVDLRKFTEKHQFIYDDVLDHDVSNDIVYRATIFPLVRTLFKKGKNNLKKNCVSECKILLRYVNP